MTPQELLALRKRSIAKHEEIRNKMQSLERGYIVENSPYKIGDKIQIGEKKIKMRVENKDASRKYLWYCKPIKCVL